MGDIFRNHDISIIASGGTARALTERGIPVIPVEKVTGWPEMFDGRVKTLHPKLHGGSLYLRGNSLHEDTVRKHDIPRIDFVVVNLYPFAETAAKPDVSLFDVIEQIDIGGPALLRGAAKNFNSVTVIIDPADYIDVIAEMGMTDGSTLLPLRAELAAKVFAQTARYDTAIAKWMLANKRQLSELVPVANPVER